MAFCILASVSTLSEFLGRVMVVVDGDYFRITRFGGPLVWVAVIAPILLIASCHARTSIPPATDVPTVLASSDTNVDASFWLLHTLHPRLLHSRFFFV